MSITRREFITTTAALAASAALPRVAEAAVPASPYAPGSYFTSDVRGAAINVTRTAAFRAFMKTHPDQKSTAYPVIRGVGGNKWGMPYAVGTASDPVWKLSGGSLPAACADLRTAGFRAPAWLGETFTGTSDSPMVVYDEVTGQTVWAAGVSKGVGYTVNCTRAAGRFMHGTNGLDRRNPASNGPKNERSRGAIPDAMVIRRDLVDRGIAAGTGLGHVLHCFFVETLTADRFKSPMVGTESSKNGWGAEGERLRIRPDLDLSTRITNPVGLVIARTLQESGMYLGDNSGSLTALKAEQVTATRNPWTGLSISATCLKGITWDDFEVVA